MIIKPIKKNHQFLFFISVQKPFSFNFKNASYVSFIPFLIVYEGKFPITFLIGSSLRFGGNGKFEPLHLIFELGFNDLRISIPFSKVSQGPFKLKTYGLLKSFRTEKIKADAASPA